MRVEIAQIFALLLCSFTLLMLTFEIHPLQLRNRYGFPVEINYMTCIGVNCLHDGWSSFVSIKS